MTEKNPEKRITLQDLFNLDWVSDNTKKNTKKAIA